MSQALENKLLFTPTVAEEIRALIKKYDGNEVFMIGTCEPDGTVTFVEPMAFGNENSVPAPAQAASPGQVLIHNHPSGILEPSDPDISIASLYGKSGIGFYITNNACDDVRVVVKPFFPRADAPINFDKLHQLFGPDGKLSQSFSHYEFRPQQLSMMRVITEAFNEEQIAVVEAGTGVGKSFAYLAPSILWALENKRRVVISTNTINLQEQLLNKDLPELARQLDREFKAVLVKGRGNYISLRRLKYASGRADLFYEDRSSELEALTRWAHTTTDGSRSDLSFTVSEDTWEAAMSDKDDCLRAQCPMFNQCHYYNSRREAANADIVVANHHLVMADVALRLENTGNEYAGILPPFERVVFDEAHNLEEVATSYFTTRTSLTAIRRQLNRIARQRDRSGVLQNFHGAIKRHRRASQSPALVEILPFIIDKILPVRDEVEVALQQYFDDFFTMSLDFFHADDMKDNEHREFRITAAVADSPYWDRIHTTLEAMSREMSRLLQLFTRLETDLARVHEDILNDTVEPRLRLFSAVKKLADHEGAISFFLSADKNEFCRWIDIGYRRGYPYIYPNTAPLDISSGLRNALFTKKKTVVLTSATLSIDNNFTYFKKQIGLDAPTRGDQQDSTASNIAARSTFLQLDTPFDYQSNCVIGIPRDLPVPSSPDFLRAIAPVIIEAIKVTEGRAMVLFTAYKPLRQIVEMCRQPLQQAGITCLMQGQMPRHQLVENFRATRKAALFATSSFWEGVDIQGDALQCLIITKLPFSVPSTPVFEARAEMVDSNGGNSFYEIAVPQAVIKFKQGFGRLIRSKSDRGFVLVLDNRVLVQRYGKMFMRSLPPAKIVEGSSVEVMNEFATFIGKRELF